MSPLTVCALQCSLGIKLTAIVQNPEYAGLGGKIGFIWMAFSIISGVYVWFFLPELKGRSLFILRERLADQIRSKP